MKEIMEETTSSEQTYFSKIKASLTDKRIWGFIVLAMVLGGAGAAIGRKFLIQPLRDVADIQFRSHEGLLRLYALQKDYHRAHGTFANDLDTLLASAPDGAELRKKLAATMDIETLAVIGDEDDFRLEANVLDTKRTSVKIRGQLDER